MNIPPEVLDKLWQAINRPDEIDDGWFLRDGLLCRTIYWTLPEDDCSDSQPLDNP